MARARRGRPPQAAARASRRRVRRLPPVATRGWPTTRSGPKSVARDLCERAMTFADYVRHYGLARSEGLLLRYLSRRLQGARADRARGRQDRRALDLTEWLGELVRQVDSSLLDEWEALRPPRASVDLAESSPRSTTAPPPVTANARAFRVLVRNELFRRVELAAQRRVDELGELDGDAGWDGERWPARSTRTSPSTTRSASTPTPAAPTLLRARRAGPALARCARSSTTPPATTTGRSPPRSTSPPPTRPGVAVVRVLDVGRR